jgi:hypothetical protein
MSVCRCGVHPSICMMDKMKSPQEFSFVFDKVYKIRPIKSNNNKPLLHKAIMVFEEAIEEFSLAIVQSAVCNKMKASMKLITIVVTVRNILILA